MSLASLLLNNPRHARSRAIPTQVEPILEVLVGKTLELSVLELMEASVFELVLSVH